ncbi:MAG TPA: hypothetical protein DHW63_00030 [Hyphomonadaceae bacterium]|nr:hypothetical protein [Hyphomonadaceae bacterium]
MCVKRNVAWLRAIQKFRTCEHAVRRRKFQLMAKFSKLYLEALAGRHSRKDYFHEPAKSRRSVRNTGDRPASQLRTGV